MFPLGRGGSERESASGWDFFMQYKLGRFLQFVGLFIILPLAMAGNMLERISVKEMLVVSAAGVGVFYVGYLLQQSGGQAP